MNTSKRPHPRTDAEKLCRAMELLRRERKMRKAAQAAIREMVSHNRRVEQTWRDGVAKAPKGSYE